MILAKRSTLVNSVFYNYSSRLFLQRFIFPDLIKKSNIVNVSIGIVLDFYEKHIQNQIAVRLAWMCLFCEN